MLCFMFKLFNVGHMNKYLQKIIDFTQTRYMKAITNGFMSIAAVTIAGSLFTLIKSIPIGPWQTFLTTSGLGDLLSIPVNITSNLMAVYVVFSMAYTLAKSFNRDGFSAGIISFGAFMILTPLTASTSAVNDAGETIVTTMENVIPVASVGAQGIFLSLICGLVATRLYVFFLDRGWKLHMPDSVPPNVAGMFEAMIPGGLVFVIFLLLRYLLALTPYGTAQNIIYKVLQAPLMNVAGGLTGCLIYMIMVKLFWWLGIHGGSIVNGAMQPIIMTASAANLAAFAAGTAAPHPEWVIATMICPSIGLLALNLLMFLRGKSHRYKSISKVALPTSLFNITEPMMFGTPIVMNPIMLVPFVLSPVITFFLTMFVTGIGLMPAPTGAGLNMFIPLPILGALVNAHWTGAVWACLMVVANMALYYPFFMVADKKAVSEESAVDSAQS